MYDSRLVTSQLIGDHGRISVMLVRHLKRTHSLYTPSLVRGECLQESRPEDREVSAQSARLLKHKQNA